MPYLQIRYPNGHEQEFVFSKAVTRIGRHSANDLQLTDETVSRFHAEIVRRRGRYIVRDLRSKNGVKVNDKDVTDCILADGDKIQIGNVSIHFRADERETFPETKEIDLVEEFEEDGGPIVQTKRPIAAPKMFEADWTSLTETTTPEIQNRLKSLTALCRHLLSADSPDDLLEETMDQISNHLPFDRGCIVLAEGEEQRLVPKVARDNTKGETNREKFAVSTTIARTCLAERSAILCTDARRTPLPSDFETEPDLELRSVLCVPIPGPERPLGIIYLESRSDHYVFTEMDLDYLVSVASGLGVGLQHLQLREERKRQEQAALIGQTISGLLECMRKFLDVSESAKQTIEKALAAGESDKIRSACDDIVRNAGEAARLLDDMLQYAETDIGKPVPADPNRVVRRAVNSFRPLARERKITLRVQLDENVREGYLHRESLGKVVSCLLQNAFDAVKEVEQPEIIISTEALQDGKATAVLVQDNGRGIAPEKHHRVFEPFFAAGEQAPAGLNLALAERLVSAMGGKIEFESEPEIGSTFVVTVPVLSHPPEPEKKEQGDMPPPSFLEQELDKIE